MTLDIDYVRVGAPVLDYVQFGQATTPPVIDGAYDSAWASAVVHSDFNLVDGAAASDVRDLRARFCGMWDVNNLYVLIEVTDATLVRDSGTNAFLDDSIEIYTDVFEKNTTYDANDIYQTTSPIELDQANPVTITPVGQPVSGGTFKMVVNSSSYVLEAAIPWSSLGTGYTAAIGNVIGFGIGINDADQAGDTRTRQIMWGTLAANLWSTSASFPEVQLTDVAGAQPTCDEIWETGFGLLSDFNRDCIVNLLDFAVLSYDWLDCTEAGNPACW